MSTINNLLDGASPYQVLQEQAGKLAGKWNKSGLLEGIDNSTEKNNMAMKQTVQVLEHHLMLVIQKHGQV